MRPSASVAFAPSLAVSARAAERDLTLAAPLRGDGY